MAQASARGKAVAASAGVELEMKGEQEPRSFELAVHVENLGVAGGHALVAEPELRGNDVGRQRLGKDVGNGVGDYAAVSPMCILALVLMRGKKLLKERRNVAVGKRVGYDGRRLGDDRGGCSNREAPDCADNGALERFIGVGVID